MKKKLKIASLFSGIGGFEEGFKQAGIDFEVVFASEIDKFAQTSYQSNFDDIFLHGDITKVNENSVPDHDLLVAGFPCQAFSIAGKQLGFEDETRGTLFFDIKRILRVKRPKYFILENVKNLVSHRNSTTIKTILFSLSKLGYAVDFTILNSKNFGVPQNRERTYIIGVYNGKPEKYDFDKNIKVNTLKQKLNLTDISSFNFFNRITEKYNERTISDVLENNEITKKFFFNNDKVLDFIDQINIYDTNKKYNKIIKLIDIPKCVINDNERQRRLYSINGIAPTVLARSDSAKVFIENSDLKIRKLSPIENLRLQGFSESFIKNIVNTGISNTQLYKQGGNAVSPPVIANIVLTLFQYKSENQHNFKFIDLFSGIGGFRIALENNNGKCVFSSDIDKYARQSYLENFGEEPAGDITKIDSDEIPDHDLLVAGFPCQPFSLAGKRLGFADTRGTLFFEIERILEEKRPKAFILENVSGIVNHDKGKTLRIIENSLEKLGYEFSWKNLNAKDYGIPQNRNRWYCVGIAKEYDVSFIEIMGLFPEKTNLKYTIDDILEKDTPKEYNISDIATNNIEKHINNYLKNKIINGVIIANNVRPSKVSFRSDGISPCLTAKMGTGGNNVPILVSKMRKLTVRECLRLMSFPENFKIKENYSQSYKQVGNSVVVDVVEKIARNLLKKLNLN